MWDKIQLIFAYSIFGTSNAETNANIWTIAPEETAALCASTGEKLWTSPSGNKEELGFNRLDNLVLNLTWKLEGFGGNETDDGQHGNATVLQLCLL